jgi:hypothetical protein
MTSIVRSLFSSALLGLVLIAPPTQALVCCPGCSVIRGERLAERIAKAGLVVHGKFSNPRQLPDPGPDEPSSLTDMRVLKVIKAHPALAKRTDVPVAGFISGAKQKPAEYIMFADVKEKQILPFDGIPVDGKDIVEYLQGAVDAQKLPVAERIGFFFKYLNHANDDIARDAYMEVSTPSFKDVASAKKHYDPDLVQKMLRDPKTQPYKFGLLGILTGVCGRKEDAEVLRTMIVDKDKRPYSGMDGLIAGYCLLEPEKGLAMVLDFLSNPEVDFNVRYAALRITTQFLIKDFPVSETKKQSIFDRLGAIVDNGEMGDLAIDELRKAEVWEYAKRVFAAHDSSNPDIKDNNFIKRAAIRYALKCPTPEAKAFVEHLRKTAPGRLNIEEENLRWEEIQKKQEEATTTVK